MNDDVAYIDDELLGAHLDDALTPAERRAVDERLRREPELAQRFAHLAQTRSLLATLERPDAPIDLGAQVHARLAARRREAGSTNMGASNMAESSMAESSMAPFGTTPFAMGPLSSGGPSVGPPRPAESCWYPPSAPRRSNIPRIVWAASGVACAAALVFVLARPGAPNQAGDTTAAGVVSAAATASATLRVSGLTLFDLQRIAKGAELVPEPAGAGVVVEGSAKACARFVVQLRVAADARGGTVTGIVPQAPRLRLRVELTTSPR